MAQRWFYRMLGEEFGPVPETELRQLVILGTLSVDDQVRLESFAEWLAVSEALPGIHELSDVSELADLSELNFEFGETGTANTSRNSIGSIERTSAGPTIADQRGHSSVPESTLQLSGWFYQSLGQLLGPVSLTDLIEMAETSQLHGTDLVRNGSDGTWVNADEVNELAAALLLADNPSVETAQISSTTQKRISSGAPGIADDKTSEQFTMGNEAPATAMDSNPDVVQTTRRKGDSGEGRKSKSGRSDRSKTSRRDREQKKDDAVLNEIFDEVFTEDAPAPRRSLMPATDSGLSATSDTNPGIDSKGSATPVPATLMSSSSASAAGRAASAMASGYRPAASAPSSLVSKGSSGGMNISMPDPKILIAIVALLAVGGYLWQFGFPISLTSYSVSDIPGELQTTLSEYKTKATAMSQSDWNSFAVGRRAAFKSMYDAMLASNSTGPENAALLLALKQGMTFVASDFSLADYRKTQFEKFEKLMADVKK